MAKETLKAKMVLTFANHCQNPKGVCTGGCVTASVCSYHCQTYLPIGKSLPNSSSDCKMNVPQKVPGENFTANLSSENCQTYLPFAGRHAY
jgi:hypothetical protein